MQINNAQYDSLTTDSFNMGQSGNGLPRDRVTVIAILPSQHSKIGGMFVSIYS